MLAKNLADVLKTHPEHEVVVEDAELQIIGIKVYSYNKIKLITNGYFSNRDKPPFRHETILTNEEVKQY